jgi:hypothetical protein
MVPILFSTFIFIWFLLFYLKKTKLNPSIAYIFLIIPILYLYINTILYRKNDIDKLYIIFMFTIIDILPLPLLIIKKQFILQFDSFILFIFMIFTYLMYIVKYKKIDINELYKYYLFDSKIFN